MTLRQTLAATAALAIALHLSGCDRPNPANTSPAADGNAPPVQVPPGSGDHPSPTPAVSAPSSEIPATEIPPTEIPPLAVQPSPDRVLRDWAAAIERRDWAAVRALWGHGGADSGLSRAAFALRWDRWRRPRVTVGSGEQDGAAGSLFYTAPVTIADGARTLSGKVTLRRVNDVPGATAEQLRWHLDTMTRAPWTKP